MFVQSAAFVEAHRKDTHAISIYGQEKTEETIRLCKMNLAVHGLSGDIRQGLTYYVDRHSDVDGFDFVMANPPFNVKEVDKEKLKAILAIHSGCPRPTTPTISGFRSSIPDSVQPEEQAL
jgi:type I restriction enzyme M protein